MYRKSFMSRRIYQYNVGNELISKVLSLLHININKLIIDKRECVKNCELNDLNKYEFRNKCYPQCPKESKESIDNEYYCEALCDEDKPFIIVETQECVEWCSLDEISKSCLVRYIGEISEEIKS